MNRKIYIFILTAVFLLFALGLAACQPNQPPAKPTEPSAEPAPKSSSDSVKSDLKSNTPETSTAENNPAANDTAPTTPPADDGGVNQVNNSICLGIANLYQDQIYYADRDGLYQTDLSFKKHKKLADIQARSLIFHNHYLYLVNMSDNFKLYHLDLKDFQLHKLTDFHTGDFQIIDENLYFANSSKNLSLYRYYLTNGQIDKLLPNVEAEHLLVNQGELYYVNWNWNGALERLTAEDKAEIVGPAPVAYINTDEQGNLYYNFDGVYRRLAGRTDFVKIYDAMPTFFINVFQGQIYFNDHTNLFLYKMDCDGQNVTPIAKEEFQFFNVIAPDVLLVKKEEKGDVYLIRKAEGSEEYTVTLMKDLRE